MNGMETAQPEPAPRALVLRNRFLNEVLPDGSWRGHPCVVVGGGPSYETFDCARLRGWRTIGINRAFERFEPTVLFSMDERYYRWVVSGMYDAMADGAGAAAKFAAFRGYKAWLMTRGGSFPEDVFVLPAYRNYETALQAFVWSSEEGIGSGNNSGYGALQLAVVLGANPIYLVGFDMRHRGAKTHGHSGHPIPQQAYQVEHMRTFFERAAPAIKARGFRVVNLCADSALRCFEFGDPEEVFR